MTPIPDEGMALTDRAREDVGQLTHEERVHAALARRGALTIAEFTHGAGVACRVNDLSLTDEQYVRACEALADELGSRS